MTIPPRDKSALPQDTIRQ